MKKIKITIGFYLLLLVSGHAQQLKRVLFVGNSYVYTNNLPLMVSMLASAHGDSVYFDSSAPGGYTFQQHCSLAATLTKIAQGNWNYVVLQEQSQLPSFPPSQVATDCLPYAYMLDSLIHAADSCAETVFYMTWGRKNGDAANCPSYPPLCTYAGMQGRLRDSYLLMGQQNNASVAPVGCAWREVRNQNPLFDLYVADESHPTVYGSYVAACVFYSTFFKKPVTSLSYTAGLSIADAALIQQQCNLVMFDSLQTWFSNGNIPFASFNKQQNLTTFQFNNTSLNAISYKWNFGDGTISTQINPQHTYTVNGTYPIKLTAYSACDSSSFIDTIVVTTVSVNELTNSPLIQLQYNGNEIKLFNADPAQVFTLKIFSANSGLIFRKYNFRNAYVGLRVGTYIIQLKDRSGNLYTGKLIAGKNATINTFLKIK